MIFLEQIDPTKRYSEHLTGSEILSASTFTPGTSAAIDERLPRLFEVFRKFAGSTPVKLNSAFRNFIPVGGSNNSSHLRGKAFDLGLTSDQLKTLKSNLGEALNEAYALGLCGFGVYAWGVHVDCDDTLSRPNYWSSPDGSFSQKIRHWGSPWLSLGRITSSGAIDKPSAPSALVASDDGKEHKEEQNTPSFLLPALFVALALSAFFILK